MNRTERVALITGASQGIGRACALKLAHCGTKVILLARNREKLEEVAGEIRELAGARPVLSKSGEEGEPAVRGGAYVVTANVENEDEIRSVFKSVIAEFGKIDILVNNAGVTRDQLILRMKRSDWDAVINTNLTSAYLCTQQAIGSMLKQRWGRIINVTSIFGQMGQAGQANYASSKAGLIGLTMAVARELGSRNITCNAVAPGFIDTAMTSVLSEDFKQNALKMIPLGRIGTPDDVANCVAFLASEESGYITGHVLNVNGGMLMG